MRINGFEQIKAFYSWVFNNPDKVRPTHISLYLFLWNQGNRANWVDWFKCPYDLAMQGACIGNKGTYYRCLDDLQKFGLIKYKKGLNNYKAPQIHLIKLYSIEPLTEQVSVPLSEQLSEHPSEQLSELLSGNIYKLITTNYKRVNERLEQWLSLDNEKPKDDSASKFTPEKFLEWFNNSRTKLLEKPSNVNFLSRESEIHLEILTNQYAGKDFGKALHNICNDKWANESNNIMPKHFLNPEQFTKYLDMEQKPLISKKQKIHRGWVL